MALREVDALKVLRTGKLPESSPELPIPPRERAPELWKEMEGMLQSGWRRSPERMEVVKQGLWRHNEEVAERILRGL